MSYIDTNKIVAALADRLESLTLSLTNQEKLLQRVDVFGANRLVEAMKATFASEARVCFIVPGGDTHQNSQPDALAVHSRRTTRIALLFADRVMDSTSSEAVTGGKNAVGILALKDAIASDLTDRPLALPGVALIPTEGEPIVISPEDSNAGTIGREAWLQWFATYAGETVIAVP